jgi:regulatory protein
MGDTEKRLFEKAYNTALNILDRANQTEKTLFDKLVKKEFSEEISQLVVNKLVSLRVINDEEYAKSRIEYMLLSRFFGYKKILYKLNAKGINKDIVKKYYDEILAGVENGEEEIAKKYILKNIRVVKKLYKKNELNKIRYRLFSCGFSSYSISTVMKELGSLIE